MAVLQLVQATEETLCRKNPKTAEPIRLTYSKACLIKVKKLGDVSKSQLVELADTSFLRGRQEAADWITPLL